MKKRVGRLRIWTVTCVVLALTTLGGISCIRILQSVEPVTGVEWVQSASGALAIEVDPEGAAWAAGLRPGDLLETVDGRPMESALDAAGHPWTLEAGQGTILGIRRGSERLEIEFYPVYRQRLEPYGYLCLVGVAFLLSGTFTALRLARIRGGIAYTVLAYTLFIHLTISRSGAGDALDWLFHWMDLLAGALAPAVLIHLALNLAKRALSHYYPLLAYVPSMLLGIVLLWAHPQLMGGAYRFEQPAKAIELIDRLEVLFLGLSVPVAMFLMSKAHNRVQSLLRRSQLRWMMWGLTLGLAPFVLLYALPWGLGATELPGWSVFMSVLPMLVMPAAFTAALARYRLHDLDLIFRRGLVEVASVILTFAVYAISVYILRQWLVDVFDLSKSASRYIGILLAAISYPQMRIWMKSGVDRAFYRKRYSYRATLLDWARELSAEPDLHSLLERLRDRIRQTLGAPRTLVLVLTDDGTLRDPSLGDAPGALDADENLIDRLGDSPYILLQPGDLPEIPWARYLFGMRVKGRLRAVLAVAERNAPEEPLSTEDRSLLSTLAAHTATAIESARLVDKVRRHAEEVERVHAREQTVLESSAVGLLMLDGEGKILAWNRALEEIYALPRSEAIGRTLADVFPLHFVRHIEREMAGSPGAGEARVFRYTLINRVAERVIVNLTISPVIRERHGAGARVVTFDDVTERVKLEEQVLRQERLASLGQLAAGVAHEVNTPLTGISSYAQMLLEDLDPSDPRRETLSKIEAQTRKASDIANSLLNLASPDRTAFEELSINDLVQETLALFEPQIRRRKTELEITLQDDLPSVRGHRGKLQQVLLNLLLNARDAVDGSGMIEVRTVTEADRVILEITDDGAGISEEDLPRIFDPFFTTKGRGRGTGLGLSISYGIVHEHEGEMSVGSEPGQYTRFRVELPSARAAEAMA